MPVERESASIRIKISAFMAPYPYYDFTPGPHPNYAAKGIRKDLKHYMDEHPEILFVIIVVAVLIVGVVWWSIFRALAATWDVLARGFKHVFCCCRRKKPETQPDEEASPYVGAHMQHIPLDDYASTNLNDEEQPNGAKNNRTPPSYDNLPTMPAATHNGPPAYGTLYQQIEARQNASRDRALGDRQMREWAVPNPYGGYRRASPADRRFDYYPQGYW